MYKKTSRSLLIIRILLCLIFLNPVYADETAENNLVIENAWIAEAPPVSKVMVAYMTLRNTGQQTIEIISAVSETYSSIEFHETVHEEEMARMVRYDSLKLPAHSTLELKRGGPHLMLFNPNRPLKAGDSVNIKLITANKAEQTVSVAVKKLP